MGNLNCFATVATIPAIALVAVASFPGRGETTNTVNITCSDQSSIPTVLATFSNQKRSQIIPILSFLPQYFSSEEASVNCQNTASKLQVFYSQDRMNYLASDTIGEKPVVCAVERRGLSCDSYSSEILFSLAKPISPTELLYNMLGENFKGSHPPSSRTVSRIYTNLKPSWWPF